MLLPLVSGLGTGLALIVAIGVQNTYLLRLAVGARLRVVVAAVLVCALSDAALIVAGVLGVGAVVERFPVALLVVRWVGAAFLVTYGVLAARRALRPSGGALRVDEDALDDGAPVPAAAESRVAAGRTRTAPPGQAPTVRVAVVTMLVFTWANPHVYLDTLVFLGSVANQQGPVERWPWTVGAVLASCLWFAGLGFGGRLLRPLFERPTTWRVFDGLVAVVMLGFGVSLVVGA